HQLALILLEQLLLIGELAVDAAALAGQGVDLLLQLLHLRVGGLPVAVDRGEGLRLAVQLLFALTERRQDGLQFPQFFNVLIQPRLQRRKRRSCRGTPLLSRCDSVGWDRDSSRASHLWWVHQDSNLGPAGYEPVA